MIHSVNKKRLWFYVEKGINRFIQTYHIASIISILLDEMLEDLKAGKKIKITNFGVLYLQKAIPRKYWDVIQQKVIETPGHPRLRFELSRHIRRKLLTHLDTSQKSPYDR
jgi:nucleoid DNA-binding protein